MFNTVIFDIDGTLLDTSQGVTEAIKFTINEFGLKKLNKEELKNFVGYSPLKKGFMHFCNVDGDMANLCCETYRKYYKEKSAQLCRIYEGIIPLLDLLKIQKYKLGVATFKNEENAKLLLKALEIDYYFDYVSGANYEKEQTKTDILKKCLYELKSNPKETIFIGDSHTDAAASEEVGCMFIGVTYGFGFKSEDDLSDILHKKIFDNVSEVGKYIISRT